MMWCKNCGEYTYDRHACEEYEVNIEGDWWTVYASGLEGAAERAAREYDQDGDYTLTKGGEVIVLVRRRPCDSDDDSKLTSFRVLGEPVTQYYVSPVVSQD